ncbi:MAG: hypothetical protein GX271_11000 [Clostridiales bacterium]|jgi:hypothetical protein|nr:hypothetical protein [Clostridiales bacterium]
MKKKFLIKCLISLGLLLFFTFLPQIMPTNVSIARASEVEKEKNNEYRLNLRTITLVNGKSFTLRVYNLEKDAKVSFKSADPEIASVNEEGTITANKVGSTTITATVRLGLNTSPLYCEVTVGPPAFSVKLTRTMIILEQDQVFQLEAVLKPTNTAELVKYSSFDSTIASVSSGGRVTAKKPGMTYIFAEIDATNQDGSRKYSSCSVIVSSPEDVAQINEYFAQHPELSLISEAERSNALYDFFNSEMSASGITNQISTSTEAVNNENTDIADTSQSTNSASKSTDTASKEPTPTPAATSTQANAEASNLSASASNNGPSLVDSLDKHLDSRFNLAELKQKYNERFQIITEVQLSSLYGFVNLIKR